MFQVSLQISINLILLDFGNGGTIISLLFLRN